MPDLRPARTQYLTPLQDRVQPHSLEAEMSVLGSAIMDGRCVADIQTVLAADDFYKPAHAAIFECLVALHDGGNPVDLVQLNQAVKDRGLLEQVGGTDYLVELAESVPSPASAVYYAKIVKDKAVLRRLIEAGLAIVQRGFEAQEQKSSVHLELAEAAIFGLSKLAGDGEHKPRFIGDILSDRYEHWSHPDRGAKPITTGLPELDDVLEGGIYPEFVVLGGRPSHGKTSLAMQFADQIAINAMADEAGGPVVFFSCEMSAEVLADRYIAPHAEIHASDIRVRKRLRADDLAKLAAAVASLAKRKLIVLDKPSPTVSYIRSMCRRLAVRHGRLAAVLIDYLQLLSIPQRKEDTRATAVGEACRALKALQRELGVPLVLLSQLNRASEYDKRKPRLSDLRDSGSIEQDADVVLLLHNPPDERAEPPEILVAKQRNGPTGVCPLLFVAPTVRFETPRLRQQRAIPSNLYAVPG